MISFLAVFSILMRAWYKLYHVGSDKVAVMSHAAVFSAADNYLSGNFVPIGQAIPSGLREDMMCAALRTMLVRQLIATYTSQRVPSFKCNYTFAFDTAVDKSFYTLQAVSWYPVLFRGFRSDGSDRARRSWRSI